MSLLDLTLRALDVVRMRVVLPPGIHRIGDPAPFFDDETGRPGDAAYDERLDHVNETFESWLDPGDVVVRPEAVRHEDGWLSFPSPRPRDTEDRTWIRRHEHGELGDVAVLFHHWMFAKEWRSIEWLLAPIRRHLPVFTMVAPHHLRRTAPGLPSGVGIMNPNPLRMFEGLRQWQAEHAATVNVLQHHLGIRRVVLLGYSLGAYCSLLARLFSPPLPLVATCATNCYARGVWEGAMTRPLVPKIEAVGFDRASFGRATRALHLARWAPRIGGEEVTWIAARDDRLEPRDSMLEVAPLLRPERHLILPGGHGSAPLFRRRIANEVLRLAGWDAAAAT